MTRQAIIRVMLSLLLLLSQQMAISHGMTHWAGSAQRGAAQLQKASGQHDERGAASSFAQGQACEQCLAFAQIAGAIGSPVHGFVADPAASCAVAASPTHPGWARASCPFQSRAPPSLS